MPPRSAGLLLYRHGRAGIEVLLVHPGGPFWKNKDEGAWQIPKGLIGPGETAADAALREAAEELGSDFTGTLLPLGELRQAGGKYVEAFALQSSFDPETLSSNMFAMEWPPRSGRMESFPEVDRAAWFSLADAHEVMLASQRPFLGRLADMVRP